MEYHGCLSSPGFLFLSFSEKSVKMLRSSFSLKTSNGRVGPAELQLNPRRMDVVNVAVVYALLRFHAWTYGTQLWGTASTSSLEILERLSEGISEHLRRNPSPQYRRRFSAHPNDLVVNLMELSDNRRLRRHLQNDLPPDI
jgi:hypothetical protein